MIKWVLIVLAALLLTFVGASFHVSRPVFDESRGEFTPVIADRDEALTFARSPEGLIHVVSHDGDSIAGINLTRIFGEAATLDFISFVNGLDPATLDGLDADLESFPVASLGLVVDYAFPYVAAGTNFTEHAEEVYSDDPPFLFPKLAFASDWQTPVPFTPRLDFEAELCVFPLGRITRTSNLPNFGLVLCNDFTDRWTLVRQLDLGEPLGRTGFADGKGRPGFMPTGYLVVIPRSPDFISSISLSLYVNNELRQQFPMSDVILPVEEIVAQALEHHDVRYQRENGSVPLLPEGHIPAGTLILTGTAAGVLFKPLNIWRQGFYLQPGDVVRTEASWLGHLENVVQPDGAL